MSGETVVEAVTPMVQRGRTARLAQARALEPEAFTDREWAALTRLAEDKEPDARRVQCPVCEGAAIAFPSDARGPFIVCARATCGENEIARALERRDDGELQNAVDIGEFA